MLEIFQEVLILFQIAKSMTFKNRLLFISATWYTQHKLIKNKGTSKVVPHCAGRDADYTHPSSAEVKNEWELYLLSPQMPPWCVMGQLYQ
jgi:hypothetical protein